MTQREKVISGLNSCLTEDSKRAINERWPPRCKTCVYRKEHLEPYPVRCIQHLMRDALQIVEQYHEDGQIDIWSMIRWRQYND